MADYIKWIRGKVGHERIFLNVAGGWVENEQGQILLQKRSSTEELWGFPGGIIELGESAEEAAIREVKEETGLDVEVDSLIGIYTKYFATYPNGDQAQVILVAFRMSIVGGELYIDMKESFDLRFFDVDKTPRLFDDTNQAVLDDIKAGRAGVYR